MALLGCVACSAAYLTHAETRSGSTIPFNTFHLVTWMSMTLIFQSNLMGTITTFLLIRFLNSLLTIIGPSFIYGSSFQDIVTIPSSVLIISAHLLVTYISRKHEKIQNKLRYGVLYVCISAYYWSLLQLSCKENSSHKIFWIILGCSSFSIGNFHFSLKLFKGGAIIYLGILILWRWIEFSLFQYWAIQMLGICVIFSVSCLVIRHNLEYFEVL